MRLRQHAVGIIAGVSAMALVGLMALQMYLLLNAVELEKQVFERNVAAAMQGVVRRLELSETASQAFDFFVPKKDAPQVAYVVVEQETTVVRTGPAASLRVRATAVTPEIPLTLQNDTLIYRLSMPQRISLRMIGEEGGVDTVLAEGWKPPGVHRVLLGDLKRPGGNFFFEIEGDSVAGAIRIVHDAKGGSLERPDVTKKRAMVEAVINRMIVWERKTVDTRARPAVIDSLLKISLTESGITLGYAFAVFGPAGFKRGGLSSPEYGNALTASPFNIPLFPNDIFFNRTRLALYFPDQTMYLARQVWPLVAVTLALMGALIWCFTATLRALTAQKRFYRRLIDFINNMTHEFKTPISTISIATETMLQPDIAGRPERVARYSGIIREENRRMQRQVDAILQMAVLEEGSYDLHPEPVDVHAVLEDLTRVFTVQAEARQGAITTRFDAERAVIQADPAHLENIFRSVLDNAIKYSPDAPRIDMATDLTGERLRIRITDHGIGIPARDLPHVFDKYYRVSTGNRHDVKGFGLGLSYVRLMTQAHQGTVALNSAPGQGTTVTLTFPLA